MQTQFRKSSVQFSQSDSWKREDGILREFEMKSESESIEDDGSKMKKILRIETMENGIECDGG
jgi:hypothetical protein